MASGWTVFTDEDFYKKAVESVARKAIKVHRENVVPDNPESPLGATVLQVFNEVIAQATRPWKLGAIAYYGKVEQAYDLVHEDFVDDVLACAEGLQYEEDI